MKKESPNKTGVFSSYCQNCGGYIKPIFVRAKIDKILPAYCKECSKKLGKEDVQYSFWVTTFGKLRVLYEVVYRKIKGDDFPIVRCKICRAQQPEITADDIGTDFKCINSKCPSYGMKYEHKDDLEIYAVSMPETETIDYLNAKYTQKDLSKKAPIDTQNREEV